MWLGKEAAHIRMKKVTTKEIINVTIPFKEAVKRGTLRNIIKDADLTVEEFVDLL